MNLISETHQHCHPTLCSLAQITSKHCLLWLKQSFACHNIIRSPDSGCGEQRPQKPSLWVDANIWGQLKLFCFCSREQLICLSHPLCLTECGLMCEFSPQGFSQGLLVPEGILILLTCIQWRGKAPVLKVGHRIIPMLQTCRRMGAGNCSPFKDFLCYPAILLFLLHWASCINMEIAYCVFL